MSRTETTSNSTNDSAATNDSVESSSNASSRSRTALVELPALSNICISSAGNWGCYQAGVMRYCAKHFDTRTNMAGNAVLFTGASSGSLVAFLILGGWDPVRILTLFSQYYLTHHVLFAGDAASLSTQYLKDMIHRELSTEQQQAVLENCNRRLFIHISERVYTAKTWFQALTKPRALFKGILKHGWSSLNEVLDDIERSCAIPMFTSPFRALTSDEPTYLDGAFTDCSPRLLYSLPENTQPPVYYWDEMRKQHFAGPLPEKYAHTSEPVDTQEEGILKYAVPYMVISPKMWRYSADSAQLPIPINMNMEFISTYAQLGYADAYEHHEEFKRLGLMEIAPRKKTTA